MTCQYPRLRKSRDRRYLQPVYPPRKPKPTRVVSDVPMSDRLLLWLDKRAQQLDVLVACGIIPKFHPNPRLLERSQGAWARLKFVALLLVALPRLWCTGGCTVKTELIVWWWRFRAAVYQSLTQTQLLCYAPSLFEPERPRRMQGCWFPWTRYRVCCFVYGWLYPPVLWLRLTGPRIVKPTRPLRLPDRRWSWQPGIAFAPAQEVFRSEAETTTTADPGTGGTSLAVTSRSLFPQTSDVPPPGQFHIVVQNSETDKTNREIMIVTGGFGTGAGSFTVTRGADPNTAAVAHPVGSYVAQVITATMLKNMKINAVGFFNVKDQYGATGDGATDDYAAINNAINAISTVPDYGRGGKIMFPEGTFRIGTTITFPTTIHSGVYKAITLIGVGKQQTDLRRVSGFQGIMIDYSGSITAGNVVTRRGWCNTRDLSFHAFNGADTGAGAPIFRMYYHQTSDWMRVHTDSNAGAALVGVEFQDSRFHDCWFNYCSGSTASTTTGSATGLETIRLLSRADGPAASGTFGYSADNCNNVWFTDCEMTNGNAAQAGVIVVSTNGGTSNPHRIFFTNNKIEGNPYTSDVVKLWNCKWIRFTNSDFSGYSYNGSTSITWANLNTAESISFRGCVWDDENTANMTHAALKLATSVYVNLEDCVFVFGTVLAGDTTAAVIAEFVGTANDQFYYNNYSTSFGTRTTPLFTGTLPNNFFGPARVYNLRVASDQALAAGTALQSITALVFGAGANTVWNIDCIIFLSSAAANTGGGKPGITVPASTTMSVAAHGPAASATAFTSAVITASATATGVAFNTVASTTAWIRLTGTISVAGTAGNVQIQLAKGITGDTITVKANSNLIAQKL